MQSKPIVLITGGTGLIGKYLAHQFSSEGFSIRMFSRKARESTEYVQYYQWNVEEMTIDEKALKNVAHIVHLAGASIANRWTNSYKKQIIDSRVNSTKLLLQGLKQANQSIETFSSASASGFYPKNMDILHTEDEPAGEGFLASVCKQWEDAANEFQSVAKRVLIHRIGFLLSNQGGALVEFIKPVGNYVAPIFGTGTQVYPWIHLHDLAQRFIFSVTNESISGTFNANTGNCSQQELIKQIRELKNPKALKIRIPQFALKLMLGEMSTMLTDGIAMDPSRLNKLGFQSKFTSLEHALEDLIV